MVLSDIGPLSLLYGAERNKYRNTCKHVKTETTEKKFNNQETFATQGHNGYTINNAFLRQYHFKIQVILISTILPC